MYHGENSMDGLDRSEELRELPIIKWSRDLVRCWLTGIGLQEKYIQRLYDEELNGACLLIITSSFLKESFEMKLGPTLLIITKRDRLVYQRQHYGGVFERGCLN